MFAKPKPALEVLFLDCALLSLDESVAGKMKSSLSNLRLFTLYLTKQKHIGLYCTLLRACTNLRRVRATIGIFCSQKKATDAFSDLLEAMKGCEKLEYVDIRGSRGMLPRVSQVDERRFQG